MTKEGFYELRDSLRTLRDQLPALRVAAVGLDDEGSPGEWQDILRRNVLPALDFELPVLLVAVCGGGSTGKSTLFNALAGEPLSTVGFTAGLTARVLLAGHPDVLASSEVAQALLYRLGEAPVPWHRSADTTTPGPPLFATSSKLSKRVLLIDTPDFDTGIEGRLVNRELAEPVLRTAEVIIYVFNNTVYNNLSNTQFMSEVVGGIGGRPIVLVYRISRVADDGEVLSHCMTVARRLYPGSAAKDDLPPEVLGIYRVHESDAVAQGRRTLRPIPVGDITKGCRLGELLSDLDVGPLKRHAFAADLREIRRGATRDLVELRTELVEVGMYGRVLRQVMADQALEALRSFPAHEAVGLATKLFLESSPPHVRWLRATGRVFALPFLGLRKMATGLARIMGDRQEAPAEDPVENLRRDLLLAANALRNRLLDDALIVRVTDGDPLLAEMSVQGAQRVHLQADGDDDPAPIIEPLGSGLYNLHVPVPERVRALEPDLVAQDWDSVARTLGGATPALVGLPSDIQDELRTMIASFRQGMRWTQRLRESFFASLSALPPLLGVTYTVLTANPVVGSGIWIQLQSIFGLNDLWALVSIPAAAGLSERDRKQLGQMISPVFSLWFERRLTSVVALFSQTVCRLILQGLEDVPAPDDPRLAQLDAALDAIAEAT